MCRISVCRFCNGLEHSWGKHLIEKKTLVHLCVGHKVVVVFLEMAHIQVQYPLYLANKLSTNHRGNPVQFRHHRNNYKLEFLVDHTN